MKLRLKDDVHFVPWPGGVWVVMASRSDLGFRLPGRENYEWLRRLAPFLNGEHTLDELAASLDAARRERMSSLIAQLQREGAVRDATLDLPHTLPAEVRGQYARVIGFISRGADSPEHRFQRYRESNPVVVGAGLLVAPLVHALLTTGVARVQLAVTTERPTDLARLREWLALSLGPDADGRLEVRAAGGLEGAVAAAGGGVLHVSEPPMSARARTLAGLCGERGVPFGQAAVVGDEGVIWPVGQPGAGEGPGDDLPDAPASELLAGPTAAFVSNHLCASYLKAVAGLPREAPGKRVVVDLETLQTRLHEATP
jgi:hypothetical protein